MNTRVYIVGAILIAAFVAMGAAEMMRSQMPYYETLAEVKAAPAGRVVQFIGAIVPGSPAFNTETSELSFVLKDTNGDTMPVRFKGAQPSGFDSAPKLLVKGVYTDSLFAADSVQTKCPSKYESR